MKVSSPVGDFPFDARRLKYEDRALVIEGSMGAWPAEIRVAGEDAPMIVRLVPWPILVGLALLGIVGFIQVAKAVSRPGGGGRRDGGKHQTG